MEEETITSSHPFQLLEETLGHEECHGEVPSFSIDREMLTKLLADNSLKALHQSGGIHGIAAALETNLDTGISGQEQDLRHRRQAFGSNLNVENDTLLNSKVQFPRLVIDAIKDTTVVLLLCCLALSLGLEFKRNGFEEGILDGVFALVVISGVVCISTTVELVKHRRTKKLSRKRKAAVKVMRDGRVQTIAFSEVVVGDIVCLEPGDQVPADGLFVHGKALKLDDDDDNDDDNDNGDDDSLRDCFHRYEFPFMFSGAKVVSGYCCMLVTAVGESTETSKMMKLSKGDQQKKEPKLQIAVDKMNSRLEKIWLSLSLLFLAVQVVLCFTCATTCGDQSHDPDPKGVKNTGQEIMAESTKIIKKQGPSLNRYTEMLSVLAFVTRDVLPLGLLVSLAYASKKFTCHGAKARNLPVCGSIGLVTTICSGRTSDLSMDHGKMVDLWIGTDAIEKSVAGINIDVRNALHEAIAISLEFADDRLLFWAKKVLAVDRENVKGNFTIEAFDIHDNRAGCLLKWHGGCKNIFNMHWKGDPETILSMCTHYFDRLGALQTLDDHKRGLFKIIIEDVTADQGLQSIAFACREIEEDEEEEVIELAEPRLTWLALVGLKNPYASDLKEAIEDCGESGVKMKLLLEDDIDTAKLIAINSGIIKPKEDAKEAVIEASEFRNISHEARLLMVDKISVIANASALDKLLMVQCLKQKGEVVAVTGSSTRDSPSLKEANVGVSLGERSSQMAKENSDIVILDKKFAAIVNILNLGRCVCNNIRKFIQLQLTINITAFALNLVAAIFSIEVPLQPFQLLWVNLTMAVLGALALAAPISLPPPPPTPTAISSLTTKTVWRNITVQVLYQVSVLLIIQFKGKHILHANQKILNAIVLNSFVFCQVFVLINAKEMEKPNIFEGTKRLYQKYPWFLVISGSIFILDVAIIEIVAIASHGKRLNLENWCVCICVAVMSLPTGLVAKFISWP